MKKLFLLFLALPALAFAQAGLPSSPYLYVVGTGETSAPADQVEVSFSLSATETDPAKAKQIVGAQSENVFKLIESLKIAEKDFSAFALSSTPQYNYDRSGNDTAPRLIGYQVTRSFNLTLRDLTQYATLMDGLFALKIVQIGNASPSSTKSAELKEVASRQALEKARAQAEVTAKSTGMRIKGVYAVSPVAFPEILPGIFGGVHSGSGMRQFAMAKDSGGNTYVFPPVETSSTLHVIYLIEAEDNAAK